MQTTLLVHEVWAVHVLLADWGIKEIAVQFGQHPADPGAEFICVIAKQGNKEVPLTIGKLEQDRGLVWTAVRNWIDDIAKKPPSEAAHQAREQQLAAIYRATDAFRERESLHQFLRANGLQLGLLH